MNVRGDILGPPQLEITKQRLEQKTHSKVIEEVIKEHQPDRQVLHNYKKKNITY